MRSLDRIALALAAFAAALAAPTALAMPRHVDVVLAPGKVHEDCFALKPGARIQYNFTQDRPGSFNLHYHQGNDVVYPLKSDSVREQKGDFTAVVAQEYCLMWTGGKGGDTRLGYEFILVEPGLVKY
jgi:hypothetical protein